VTAIADSPNNSNRPADAILKVEDLRVWFPHSAGLFGSPKGWIKAVDGISFSVRPGETLGIVGESGCGKTTAGRAILRLLPRGSAQITGRILFEGRDLYALGSRELRALRRHAQIIFQDPVGSLNPRMTVGSMIAEPMLVHRICGRDEVQDQVAALLRRVGFQPDAARRYPHEFSGGQRQRIGIARALALKPRLIICDEPVSALDVSIQAQVLNLLADLRRELGLSYVFIAHNLAVVEHFSDRVAVMYLGKIVELGPAGSLVRNPRHPYTRALLSAVPMPVPDRAHERTVLQGEVPSPVNPPGGCPFHPRCPLATEKCSREMPPIEIKGGNIAHVAACWNVQ
jgi:oligopeptide/dipeptide ABC transporter ATP-binding protein